MHRTNVFRYMAIYVIENWYYKNFNLMCVVLSTVCLSLEDPLDNDILNPEFPERCGTAPLPCSCTNNLQAGIVFCFCHLADPSSAWSATHVASVVYYLSIGEGFYHRTQS